MSETFQETWHRLKELDGESHSCTDIMFCTCRNSKDAKLDGQVQTAITSPPDWTKLSILRMFPLLGEKSTESCRLDSVLFSPRRGNTEEVLEVTELWKTNRM